MDKQTVDIYTVIKQGVVQKVGKSVIDTPTAKWNGKGIKWFDDTNLIKNQMCG